MKQKHLTRSSINKILFGIIGGLSEYFDISPVFARLIFVLLLILTGLFPCGLLYIIALFIIPKDGYKVIIDIQSQK